MNAKTILQQKHEMLTKKVEEKELLTSLVRGLEDAKAGRIKPWKKTPRS